MAQVKITREDLQNQELADPSEQAVQWLRQNGKLVATIILVLLLAWTGQRLYAVSQTKAQMAANEQFSVASDAYDKALNENAWATPERTKAMVDVIAKLDAFLKTYGNAGLAQPARFLRANAYYFAGDNFGDSANTDRAIKAFEDYVAGATVDADRAAGLVGLGAANENRFFLTNTDNFLKASIDAYSKAAQLKDAGFISYDAKLSVARLFAFQGKKDDAIKIFREVYDACKSSDKPLPKEASDAQRRMQLLRRFADQFSLANTAKIELRRLGIDVDKQEQAKAASKPADAKK